MIQKRGTRWRVQVKHRGIVVADRTFDRKADAATWEREQKQQLLLGDYVPPSAGKQTVALVASSFLAVRQGQVSVRAWESDESALRVHILPRFGPQPIGAIRRMHIERFLTDLATTRSVGTAARVRTTLRGLFEYAVRLRVIRDSPAAVVRLPRPDSRTGEVTEFQPFTLGALPEVVEAHGGRAGALADVTLALGLTGVGFGELRGLRVRDVTDDPYPALVVRRSLPTSGRTGAVILRSTTKGGRSRVVPLTDVVRPVVLARAAGRQPDDLRHTAASLWICAGVDIKTVSSWLGHSSTKLTLDTYGHLMGTADRAAIRRVNAAFGHLSGTWEPKHSPRRPPKSPETLF